MRLIRLLKNDIAKEAEEWVQDEIITEPQAEAICQKYDVDYHQIISKSFGYSVLVSLGYLFIGLSIITLLGANWDEIPRAVRMFALISLTMFTHALAIRKYLSGDNSGAVNIFLLGNLFYGASIILIAQIYHLGEHMPDGIYWWALGCLPVALLMNSALLTCQALGLAFIWFFMETGMDFYPSTFPLFIVGGLITLYRGKQSLILFLSVVAAMGFWLEYTLAEIWRDSFYYKFQAEHVVVSVAMFIFAYVFSHWLNQKESIKAKDYGAVLALWSLRFGLIFMLIMSFEDPWENLITADWDHNFSMIVLVGLFSTAALCLSNFVSKLKPVIYIFPVYVLSLLAVIFSGDVSHALYFQVAYNFILVGIGVWLIMKGIRDGISHYFFLGVATILLTGFMRYIDLIGDYVGGAALFMVFAFILLGAAKYWKINQFRESSHE